jgi:hypothetical protein
MKGGMGQKPVAAETAHGLHVIERFGPLLGINDTFELHNWQTSSRYTIFIEAREKGRFDVRYQDQNDSILLVSRQPLLDCARLFLSLGANPQAVIAMRRRGKDRDDLYGPIAVAAKLTVDERKTVFAKWKPFPWSAVLPGRELTTNSATDTAACEKTHGVSDRRPATCGDSERGEMPK